MKCTNIEVVFLLAVPANDVSHDAPPPTLPSVLTGSDGLDASMTVDLAWRGGCCVTVVVSNHGAKPAAGWRTTLALSGGTMTSFWNAEQSVQADVLTVTPNAGDAALEPNASVSFGFCLESAHGARPRITSVGGR